MAKKLTGHQGKVAEINAALKAALGLTSTKDIPLYLVPMIQKTATDMCMLDKLAIAIDREDDLVTETIGSTAQPKTMVNPLLPYYEKYSSRVTDDLYNLGLTARKQAVKVDAPTKVDDDDPMRQYYHGKQ